MLHRLQLGLLRAARPEPQATACLSKSWWFPAIRLLGSVGFELGFPYLNPPKLKLLAGDLRTAQEWHSRFFLAPLGVHGTRKAFGSLLRSLAEGL